MAAQSEPQSEPAMELVRPNEESPTAGRDRHGRFQPGNGVGQRFGEGNTARQTHGGRSRAMQAGLLPGQQAVAGLIQEQAAAIVADLGGEAQVSVTKAGLIRDWVRLGLYAAGLEQHLEGGLLSSKGRCRAAATLWLQVIDRRHRVAGQIGLSRVPKSVDTIDSVIASITARKQEPTR